MRATSLTRLVLHSAPSQIVHSHGSRHIFVFAFEGSSFLFAAPRYFPYHPCPPDAHATLTGIDYARDRPLDKSI